MRKLSSYITAELRKSSHADYTRGMTADSLSSKYGIPFGTIKHQWLMHNLAIPVRRRMGRSFIRPKTIAERAYLAGIFDGEGSIAISGNHWGVSIYQSDSRLIDWLNAFGGYSGKRFAAKANLHARGITTTRDMFYWMISRRRCVLLFLRTVLPFLIVKREKAQKALGEIIARTSIHK
jgi:hypothetical protein